MIGPNVLPAAGMSSPTRMDAGGNGAISQGNPSGEGAAAAGGAPSPVMVPRAPVSLSDLFLDIVSKYQTMDLLFYPICTRIKIDGISHHLGTANIIIFSNKHTTFSCNKFLPRRCRHPRTRNNRPPNSSLLCHLLANLVQGGILLHPI